jgi:DNA processing protein
MKPEFYQRLLAAEVSPQKGRALLEEPGSSCLEESWLLAHPRLTEVERQRARTADLAAMQRALDEGAQIVAGDRIPPLLLDGAAAPPAFYAWGKPDCLHRPTVAIVGTRSASTYGKACAQKFGEALARAGVTVVSGGALGVDAAAHKGALAAGGATVAVLAAGVDNVYPSLHAGLFRQIREDGCLVSQFAAGVKPSDYRFLMRNGFIAALSLAVVVIEAPARSGALRTANVANELGREVFVVPANIGNPNFFGSHRLIRDGATLVDHPDQVLEALHLEAPPLPELAPAAGSGARILEVLSTEPLATEFIVERTGMGASEVLSELTLLELEGRVVRDAGGYALRP